MNEADLASYLSSSLHPDAEVKVSFYPSPAPYFGFVVHDRSSGRYAILRVRAGGVFSSSPAVICKGLLDQCRAFGLFGGRTCTCPAMAPPCAGYIPNRREGSLNCARCGHEEECHA